MITHTPLFSRSDESGEINPHHLVIDRDFEAKAATFEKNCLDTKVVHRLLFCLGQGDKVLAHTPPARRVVLASILTVEMHGGAINREGAAHITDCLKSANRCRQRTKHVLYARRAIHVTLISRLRPGNYTHIPILKPFIRDTPRRHSVL